MNAPARKTDHVPVAEYATAAEMIRAYRRLRAHLRTADPGRAGAGA